MAADWFRGRKLAIATSHGKEQVLAPLLETHFAVQVEVPNDLQTDQFGTFSGEIPRTGSPVEAARAKCRLAHSRTGTDLVLASEGSFGPHPDFPWIAADQEWLLLCDFAHQLEIPVYHLDLETNFRTAEVRLYDEVQKFAKEAGFPSHGIILRNGNTIRKGIVDHQELDRAFQELKEMGQPITVETDMRAMMNPTRMQAIHRAGEKLVQLMSQTCPACDTPGFRCTRYEGNLPCEWCRQPTRIPSHACWECQRCGHLEKQKTPALFAEPGVCDFCNP
jgi:hypothetical protein